MSYQIIMPPDPLKAYVRYFWTLEGRPGDGAQKSFTVMCNGLPGLVFQQAPEVFTGFEGEQLPQLFVFGQAKKYGQLHAGGNFNNIGVCFEPTALKAVFGIDANGLTDKNICISDLAKTHLTEQLLNSSSVQQRIGHISAFIQQRTQGYAEPDKRPVYAAAALMQGKKLQHVLHELNLSERSLERIFLSHVGITPILYARICRFQSSLSLLQQGKVNSLTRLAHALGYFDQSHFIRDFKLFSGVSPGIYLRKATELMPGFPEWET